MWGMEESLALCRCSVGKERQHTVSAECEDWQAWGQCRSLGNGVTAVAETVVCTFGMTLHILPGYSHSKNSVFQQNLPVLKWGGGQQFCLSFCSYRYSHWEAAEFVDFSAHAWQLGATKTQDSVAALQARGPADPGMSSPSLSALSFRGSGSRFVQLVEVSLTRLCCLGSLPLLNLVIPSLLKTWTWRGKPHCSGLTRSWRTELVRVQSGVLQGTDTPERLHTLLSLGFVNLEGKS